MTPARTLMPRNTLLESACVGMRGTSFVTTAGGKTTAAAAGHAVAFSCNNLAWDGQDLVDIVRRGVDFAVELQVKQVPIGRGPDNYTLVTVAPSVDIRLHRLCSGAGTR